MSKETRSLKQAFTKQRYYFDEKVFNGRTVVTKTLREKSLSLKEFAQDQMKRSGRFADAAELWLAAKA